jgi:hypothetical protein
VLRASLTQFGLLPPPVTLLEARYMLYAHKQAQKTRAVLVRDRCLTLMGAFAGRHERLPTIYHVIIIGFSIRWSSLP